jgi:hypothetical protein
MSGAKSVDESFLESKAGQVGQLVVALMAGSSPESLNQLPRSGIL